jgi:acyl-CoA thioesterase II
LIDFAQQTEVFGGDGKYTGAIHRELSTPMGPFGAYVAGVALRTAGAHSAFQRPASLSCHFIKPAQFGEAEFEVRTLRKTKRAESTRVSMIQEGEAVLEMLVWTVDELTGLDHAIPMPEVPHPHELKAFEELVDVGDVSNPIWQHILEGRPIFDRPPDKEPPWTFEDFEPGPPQVKEWIRLRTHGAFDDPFVEAARFLMPIDWMVSNAAFRPHEGTMLWLPTMELTAAFHDLSSGSEWMLADCESPVARGGFAWGEAKIWSEKGTLMATGAQLMIQRTGPRS